MQGQAPGGHARHPGSNPGPRAGPSRNPRKGREVQSHRVLAARGALKKKASQTPAEREPWKTRTPWTMLGRVVMLSQDGHIPGV